VSRYRFDLVCVVVVALKEEAGVVALADHPYIMEF
jgi:hypothetical protein